MSDPMKLSVHIDKELPPVVPNAISFETGLSKVQLEQNEATYEHHGPEFSALDKGALPCFYEDLILGHPFPLIFATHQINDIDTLFAIALFLHRDLAIHPSTAAAVYTIDFVHRLGLPALAHLDNNLAKFFSALRDYFPVTGLTQRELSDRIKSAVGWLREYVYNGTLSLRGAYSSPVIKILDQGTNGFVIAETSGSLVDGWVELYRMGFLRGLLVSPNYSDKRRILITRKSSFVPLNLIMAGQILNQMELAMGESDEWHVTPDNLWLESPKEGTLILVKDIIEVLVRI
jgi:hypothetical protein